MERSQLAPASLLLLFRVRRVLRSSCSWFIISSSFRMDCSCHSDSHSIHSGSHSDHSVHSDAESISPDRLSALPDALLHSILSHLPPPHAARLSLLSRRFRHLHLSSPSLHLTSQHLPPPKSLTFSAMVRSLLFSRDHPLHSLLLDHVSSDTDIHVAAIVTKAAALGLRHLTIASCSSADLHSSLPLIFSIPTLQTLTLVPTLTYLLPFPSSSTLTSLSLSLLNTPSPSLASLLSHLPSLDDLHLQICTGDAITIASPSLANLHLIIVLPSHNSSHSLRLSAPSLQTLSLETHGSFYSLPDIHLQLPPSLRKAVISLNDVCSSHLPAVSTFLAHISRVQELCLQITESEVKLKNFTPILSPK